MGADPSAQLFRGWDAKLERAVTIKLFVRVGKGAEALQRASRLSHRAVVPVHELDFDHDPPFAVMGAVDGVSLRSWVEDNGAAPAPIVSAWLSSIADYLKLAHSHGLARHELGPDLLFITRSGDARLVGSGCSLDVEGPQADIRSVGELGFFALTGSSPGENPIDVLRSAGVPAGLASTIGATLQRPERELLSALSASRDGEGA